MNVILEPVTMSHREILYGLLQQYLAEIKSSEPGPDGIYEYKWFDSYFSEAGRYAYLFRDSCGQKIMGFAMVNSYLQRISEGHSVAEFTVLPEYRRMYVGKSAALSLFAGFRGNWEVKPRPDSETAYLFWHNTIDEFTNGLFSFEDGFFVFRS